MGDCNGKRTHRAFHGEETTPAGAKAQWSASLRALCPPAYLPDATWWSGMRCMDFGEDRGAFFNSNVRSLRSPQPRCSDEHFFASPDAERASRHYAIGVKDNALPVWYGERCV